MAVGGGDPDHLLAPDEGSHPVVQPVEHLVTVEAAGPVLGPVVALQLMLAAGPGQLDRAVRRRWRVTTAPPAETDGHQGDQTEGDDRCEPDVDRGRYALLG